MSDDPIEVWTVIRIGNQLYFEDDLIGTIDPEENTVQFEASVWTYCDLAALILELMKEATDG